MLTVTAVCAVWTLCAAVQLCRLLSKVELRLPEGALNAIT